MQTILAHQHFVVIVPLDRTPNST